jgi:hypothetical protein
MQWRWLFVTHLAQLSPRSRSILEQVYHSSDSTDSLSQLTSKESMAGPEGALTQHTNKIEAENDKHSSFLRLPAGGHFSLGLAARHTDTMQSFATVSTAMCSNPSKRATTYSTTIIQSRNTSMTSIIFSRSPWCKQMHMELATLFVHGRIIRIHMRYISAFMISDLRRKVLNHLPWDFGYILEIELAAPRGSFTHIKTDIAPLLCYLIKKPNVTLDFKQTKFHPWGAYKHGVIADVHDMFSVAPRTQEWISALGSCINRVILVEESSYDRFDIELEMARGFELFRNSSTSTRRDTGPPAGMWPFLRELGFERAIQWKTRHLPQWINESDIKVHIPRGQIRWIQKLETLESAPEL